MIPRPNNGAILKMLTALSPPKQKPDPTEIETVHPPRSSRTCVRKGGRRWMGGGWRLGGRVWVRGGGSMVVVRVGVR